MHIPVCNELREADAKDVAVRYLCDGCDVRDNNVSSITGKALVLYSDKNTDALMLGQISHSFPSVGRSFPLTHFYVRRSCTHTLMHTCLATASHMFQPKMLVRRALHKT
jgi:hypothetical protein